MLILFAVNKQIGMATIDTLINEMFNPVKAFIQFEIFIYGHFLYKVLCFLSAILGKCVVKALI